MAQRASRPATIRCMRFVAAAVVLAVVVAAGGTPVTFAAEAPKLKQVLTRETAFDEPGLDLTADSKRYYAYLDDGGKVRIVDDDRGRTRAAQVDRSCGPRDARLGVLLVDCVRIGYPRLYDMATGAYSVFEDVRAPGQRRSDFFHRLGRHWISGVDCDSDAGHSCGEAYLNRATGERRVVGEQDPEPEIPSRDIHSANLDPVATPGLSQVRSGDYTVRERAYPGSTKLVLEGPGGSTRTLGDCSPGGGCHSIHFGASLVTWATRSDAYVYSLRTRMSYPLRHPSLPPHPFDFTVTHTRRSVLVAASEGLGARSRHTLYRARADRPPLAP